MFLSVASLHIPHSKDHAHFNTLENIERDCLDGQQNWMCIHSAIDQMHEWNVGETNDEYSV